MRRRHDKRNRRRGNVLVMTAFLMVGMLFLLAFALDLGYIMVADTELQRSADSAALAACARLIDEIDVNSGTLSYDAEYHARSDAARYAGLNFVCTDAPAIDHNYCNDLYGDVVLGHLHDFNNPDESTSYQNLLQMNSVTVRVRRTAESNGEIPMFFARALGYEGSAAVAKATAAYHMSVRGFRVPETGECLEMLPFALDEDTYLNMLAGNGQDKWSYNPKTKEITGGGNGDGDGLLEMNLYPQGTGAPGNRGTVNIGGNDNSTNDIARQIVDGVSHDDLEHHGGSLELDENGQLYLNGDTGISAGVKDELLSIAGKPRIIPIFREVQGPGNNAMYTIVGFAGIRILEVKLTGQMSAKRVTIQPCKVLATGIIPADSDNLSYNIYSPAHLID